MPSILRYIARAGPSTSGLYGSDALSACQVRLAPVLRALGETFAADCFAHQLLQLSRCAGAGRPPLACSVLPQPPAAAGPTPRSPKERGACNSVLPPPQVDQWLDISQSLVPGAAFESACASVNDFLSLRTFLVSHEPETIEATAVDQPCAWWGRMHWPAAACYCLLPSSAALVQLLMSSGALSRRYQPSG